MSRINVSTKIYARTYTRGGPLNPTFANWILLRKGLAQKLGLRPKISAVRGITVTWRKIIEQVRKSNADEADRITAVLTREDKNIDLETKIHIRDGRLAGRNVWEILERQELREMIEAPPRKQPVRNCFCLGEIMDTAAPNQDLDKEQIQTLRYLLWYNVFEEPKNIIPLLKREDISLDLKTKLAAAYLRIQTPFDHYNQPEEVIEKAIPELARNLVALLQEIYPLDPQQQQVLIQKCKHDLFPAPYHIWGEIRRSFLFSVCQQSYQVEENYGINLTAAFARESAPQDISGQGAFAGQIATQIHLDLAGAVKFMVDLIRALELEPEPLKARTFTLAAAKVITQDKTDQQLILELAAVQLYTNEEERATFLAALAANPLDRVIPPLSPIRIKTQADDLIPIRSRRGQRGKAVVGASATKVFPRTELRLALGLPPIDFNQHTYWAGQTTKTQVRNPFPIIDILQAAGTSESRWALENTPYEILTQKIWARGQEWEIAIKGGKSAEVAAKILKRDNLRLLLGLPLKEQDHEMVAVSEIWQKATLKKEQAAFLRQLREFQVYQDPENIRVALNSNLGTRAKISLISVYFILNHMVGKEEVDSIGATASAAKLLLGLAGFHEARTLGRLSNDFLHRSFPYYTDTIWSSILGMESSPKALFAGQLCHHFYAGNPQESANFFSSWKYEREVVAESFTYMFDPLNQLGEIQALAQTLILNWQIGFLQAGDFTGQIAQSLFKTDQENQKRLIQKIGLELYPRELSRRQSFLKQALRSTQGSTA